MGPKGSCCCAVEERILSKSDCESAHDALGLTRKNAWEGDLWSIPGGCSTRQGHSHDLHWNRQEPGSARSDLTAICKKPSTTIAGTTTTTTSSSTTTVSTSTTATTTTSTTSTTLTTTTRSSSTTTTSTPEDTTATVSPTTSTVT